MSDLLIPAFADELPGRGAILAGKYEVISLLGQGGMGVVLQARNQRTEQLVAIKLLLPDARKMPDVVVRFEREARAAARIQGSHVVRVYDVDSLPDGSPMMVMELLQGWDLGQELLARGPLPYPEAVEFMLQACEAIGHAHQMGIVHRDIKPANLFLCQEGSKRLLKVVDFGISKVVDPSGQTNQTATTAAFGTPQYMSPEQVRSTKNVDGRSDIWALGVVLYELLGGRSPFGSETSTGTLAAIIADTPEDLRNRRPDVPQKLAAAVSKALEKRVEDRFQDVAAFAAAIAPFSAKNVSAATLAHVAIPVVRQAESSPNVTESNSTKRLALISAAAATVVVGIGLAILAAKVAPPLPAPTLSPESANSSSPTITVTPATALSTTSSVAIAAPAPNPETVPAIANKSAVPTGKPTEAPAPALAPEKPPAPAPAPAPAPHPKPVEDPKHL